MTNKETLREEYKNRYYNSEFDSGALEMPDPDLEADWWLSKLEQIRNEDKKNLVEKVESIKRTPEQVGIAPSDDAVGSEHRAFGANIAIEQVLDLIKQDIEVK